ncbi:MAG: ATP-binding cassette domain-containing protein, partial [Actinobacteria bacterium]|nr:ATP-binding cassette domain-containing protein [Actinomycetota bacterium]
DVIRALPEGIETVVGERGAFLSGGQRQRLGIARALYRDAGLLLLDEATSALDQRTETEFLGALGELRGARTVIMVTHRFRTVKNCDWLVLLEAGRIVDIGPFRDLMGRCRQFQELAASTTPTEGSR